MEVVDEVGSIPYWVRESKIYLEFVHKEMPGRELGLRIAEVFLFVRGQP